MSVIFQGKTINRYPKGYTVCREDVNPARNCMPRIQCEKLLSDTNKKPIKKLDPDVEEKSNFKRSTKEDKDDPYRKEKEQGRGTLQRKELDNIDKTLQERIKEKEFIAEKQKDVLDYVNMLRQGIVINLSTGEPIRTLKPGDIGGIIKALKDLRRNLPIEVFANIPGLPNLNTFLQLVEGMEVGLASNTSLYGKARDTIADYFSRLVLDLEILGDAGEETKY